MKLDKKARALLYAVEFAADTPISELEEQSGFKDHVIHYYLKGFKEEGIITPASFFNLYLIGYKHYEVFFSMSAQSYREREAIISYLNESRSVSWMAEIAGNFQYAMSVCARNSKELSDFLRSLAQRFGNVFPHKQVSTLITLALFRSKFLVDTGSSDDFLSFSLKGEEFNADDNDLKILSALSAMPAASHSKIAESIALPRTTVTHRIRKLREAGIIKSSIFFIDASLLNMHTFHLLIYARGIRAEFGEAFFDFARHHKNIILFERCNGNWDYKISVVVDSPGALSSVLKELYSNFADDINRIEVNYITKNLFQKAGTIPE